MPPQQPDRLLDLFDDLLRFGAHESPDDAFPDSLVPGGM
jgi:hypothetical protein